MSFIRTIMRGIGQVMFQNNSLSGLLFLIGIFINSWVLGLAALFGTFISTSTALIIKAPKESIQNGVYGFNGTLTGIAVFLFFEASFYSLFALIIAAAMSTVLMHGLQKIIPPYTAPFNLVTWSVIMVFLFMFNLPLSNFTIHSDAALNLLTASTHSFGQVMFQEHTITGIFFLIGILINNRLMAVYALYAALLGSVTGALFLENSTINAGMMGYNAILCAIALTGKQWQDVVWISIAILLSTALQIGLASTGMITLTAPFVVVTWIIIKLKSAKPLNLINLTNT